MTIDYSSPRDGKGGVSLSYWLKVVETAEPGLLLATGPYFTMLKIKKKLALRGIKTSIDRDGSSEMLKSRHSARFRLVFLGKS